MVIETILPNNSDTEVTTATNGVEDNVFKRSEVMVSTVRSWVLEQSDEQCEVKRSNTMAGRNSDKGIALVKGEQQVSPKSANVNHEVVTYLFGILTDLSVR